MLSSPHKVVNANDISKDFPMNSSIGNSEVLLEIYKERGGFRNWLAKTLAGIRHKQRTESHSRLSLLIVHELSLAVRSFAGPITAMELGTSWEARYLSKKLMSPSKNKAQSRNESKYRRIPKVTAPVTTLRFSKHKAQLLSDARFRTRGRVTYLT